MEHLISPYLSQVVGLCGVITYLLSYALLQTGVIGGNSYLYTGMNAVAAVLVMVSLIHAFNVAALLIQISFLSISAFGMLRLRVLTRNARFSAEEKAFIKLKFPHLSPHLARRFLDGGTWVNLQQGKVMATEGQALDHLTYISAGEVNVFVANVLVGTRPATTFVGELSCLDASPATATVVARERCRCFVISTKRLRALVEQHSDVKLSLLASFSENTKQTLLLRTKEIAEAKAAPQDGVA